MIFLIVGEPSGDVLGARLMAALKHRKGGAVRFAGLGGPAMEAEGLESLFPISELSLFGLVEIVPRIPRLYRRMRETAKAIKALEPAAVVSIDVPAFCFGVWRRLSGVRIPLIHYVAPTVWAWRPWRARKYARHLDHMLALLPFEPPYFERAGLPCTFVGHPVIESGAGEGDGPAFRVRHGVDAGVPALGVLPGSRRGEVVQILPPFGDALERLGARFPGLTAIVPTLPHLAGIVSQAASNWPVPAIVVERVEEKYDAMAACGAALAASGTISLELALAGVPHVVAYRVNPVTSWVVRRLVSVEHANLINLLLGRPAVPELLQEACRGANLAEAIAGLLEDFELARAQMNAAREAMAMLGSAGPPPSDRAAEAILAVIEDPKRYGMESIERT